MTELATVTGFAEVASKYGISTLFAIFLLVMFFIQQAKKDRLIMEEFAALRSLAGKTVLTKEQTTGIFRAVLNIHIRRKIIFAKQKLINNHIKSRRPQIEIALSAEFKKVTQEESQFLSSFTTPAGDL